MENLKELKSLLSVPKDIIITSHRNPDGDAIGSSLAMYHYLVQHGHTVRVVLPSEYPDNFSWMKDADKIYIYDLSTEYSQQIIQKSDIIFCLDYNSLDRIDKMGDVIKSLKDTKLVMIDHHLYPDSFADFMMSDSDAGSTCELVFDFIELMGDLPRITPTLADCIYTGIVTDTGSFRFATSPKSFRIVARLLEMGANDVEIQNQINNSFSEKQLRLLGHCLYNRMHIFEEFQAGMIVLTLQDYEYYKIQRGDTEGIVNYLLTLKNLRLAAFITEQPSIVKFSLRSKGDFDVQEICRNYFNGGGHKNASGGYWQKGLTSAVDKFVEILPFYKEKLLQKN